MPGGAIDLRGVGNLAGARAPRNPDPGTAGTARAGHDGGQRLSGPRRGIGPPHGASNIADDAAVRPTEHVGVWIATAGLTATPEPTIGPAFAIVNPGPLSTDIGTPVQLQIRLNANPASEPMTYAAAGLPAGLSISWTTGTITGTPTTAGVSTVTVTATSAAGAGAVTTFHWTVVTAGRLGPIMDTRDPASCVDVRDSNARSSAVSQGKDAMRSSPLPGAWGTHWPGPRITRTPWRVMSRLPERRASGRPVQS